MHRGGGDAYASSIRRAIDMATASNLSITLDVDRNQDKVLFGKSNLAAGQSLSNGTQTIDLDGVEKLGSSNSSGLRRRLR